MAKIVMWVAQKGFRDEELFGPLDHFRKMGHDVTVVSHDEGVAKSKFGKTIDVCSLKNVCIDDVDALLLVGGPGTYDYVDDALLHDYVRWAHDEKRLVGAICYAPNILAKTGIMHGIRSAVSSDFTVTREGAICTGNSVEVDGDIITADGPTSALNWAKEIDAHLRK